MPPRGALALSQSGHSVAPSEGSMLRTLLICGLPAAAAAATPAPRTDPPPSPACARKLDQYCGNESNPELKVCYASMKAAKWKPKIPLVAAFSGKPGVAAAWRCYSCAQLQPHHPPCLTALACCQAERPGRPRPRRHAATPAKVQRHRQPPRLLLQLHSPVQDPARVRPRLQDSGMVPGPSPRASAGAGPHPTVRQRPLPHPRLLRRAHPLAGLRPLRRRRGEWHADGLLRVGRPVPDLWRRGEGGQLLPRRALLDGSRGDMGRAGLPCGRGHGRPDAGAALPLLLPDVGVRSRHRDSHFAILQLHKCQGRLRPRQRAAGGRDAGQIYGRRPELGRV